MGGCLGASNQSKKSIQNQKVSRVEEVDLIKGKLKGSRDKIDNLINQHNIQIGAVNQEIQKQKQAGLKNKPRAIYLLKQRKDFQEQVSNLNTRKQAVIKTLNMLAQQQLDLDMVNVLEESNQYMRKVQNELERKNWRQILVEAKENKYNPIQFREAEDDPQVDALYAELEKQVLNPQSSVRVKDVPELNGTQLEKTQNQLIYN